MPRAMSRWDYWRGRVGIRTRLKRATRGLLGPLPSSVSNQVFVGSARYWEGRYYAGGTSGAGSYGEEAAYKAAFLNEFVRKHRIESVIEFGCGDGNQLGLASYPRYIGLDVSETTVRGCVSKFGDDRTKSFVLSTPGVFSDPAKFLRAELALSLDVIFHLIEEHVFDRYMRQLFDAATRFIAVYAVDGEIADPAPHVRHRNFSAWVSKNTDVHLLEIVKRPQPDFKEFFLYER
jgi:hypothetical protein